MTTKALALGTAMTLFLLASPAGAEETARSKSPLLAAGLNFFVPGAGYLYNGEKPLYVSLPMIAGTVGITYLEQFHKFGDDDEVLREHDSTAFVVLFSSIFVINTALAIDAYREAKAINRGETERLNVSLRKMTSSGYGLSLSGSF